MTPGWAVGAAAGALGAVVVVWAGAQKTAARLEERGRALEASLGREGSALAAHLADQGAGVTATVQAVGRAHAQLVARKAAAEWLGRKYHLTPELFRDVARLRARIGV